MVLLSATSCCEDCTDCSKERTKTKRLYDRTKSELNIANKEKNEKEKEIESLNKEIKSITGQLYDLRNKRKKDTAKINKLIGMLSSAIDREEILIQGLDSIISNRDYINAFYNGTDSVMGVSNETLFSSKLETQEFFYKLYNAKNEANDFVNDAKKFRDNMQESQQILAEIESERSREKIQELQRQLGQKQQALDAANQKIQQYNNEIIPNKDALITKLSEQVVSLQQERDTIQLKLNRKDVENTKLNQQIKDLEYALDVAKNSIPIYFNIHPKRKIVIKEGKGCDIPIIVNENVALKQSGNTKKCIIYFCISKEEPYGQKGHRYPPFQQTDTTNIIVFHGKERKYHGVCQFDWKGEKIDDLSIHISTPQTEKLKKDWVYSYYIYMDGKENIFEENKPPFQKK